ncbi:hypothetical protein [Orrella sp. 11846]|uniref:hypothetical protein n=1 Tax=Orrella sp. 11846 TaxID=3409913 RepID=UPI003B5C8FFC
MTFEQLKAQFEADLVKRGLDKTPVHLMFHAAEITVAQANLHIDDRERIKRIIGHTLASLIGACVVAEIDIVDCLRQSVMGKHNEKETLD